MISFAPFAVVAPLIGPFIDRAPGGRRLIIQLTAIGRALLFFMMIFHLDDLLAVPAVVRRAGPAEDLQRLAIGADPDGGQHQDRTGRGQLQARPDLRSGRRLAAAPAGALAAISPKLSLMFGSSCSAAPWSPRSQLPQGVVAAAAQPAERMELRNASLRSAAWR